MASFWVTSQRNRVALMPIMLALILMSCANEPKKSLVAPPVSAETSIAPNSNLREAIAIGLISPSWMTLSLTQSLAARNMLSQNNEPFRLEFWMVREPFQTSDSLDIEMRSTFRYRVLRVSDSTVVFDREITASYTENFASNPMHVSRRHSALQGTGRKNINQFLAALIAEERKNPQAFSGTTRRPTS